MALSFWTDMQILQAKVRVLLPKATFLKEQSDLGFLFAVLSAPFGCIWLDSNNSKF